MFISRVINVKAAIFVDGSPVELKLPKNKKQHIKHIDDTQAKATISTLRDVCYYK